MRYNDLALLYAEKYGIIEYKVKGSMMVYYEQIGTSKYKATVNLKTMQETRKELYKRRF